MDIVTIALANMAPEKSVLVCLGGNRRILKCSSAEEGLPIDKVIKTAFGDVLGGEVEHSSGVIARFLLVSRTEIYPTGVFCK